MGFLRNFLTALLVWLASAAVAPDIAVSSFQGLHGFDRFACHGIIVEAGEGRNEVARKCGDPAWRDVRTEAYYEVEVGGRVASVTTEEWIYDLGHNQLLQFLRFRDGRLVTLRSGNYGFGGSRNGNCGYGANLSLGDTKLEVVARCGEPTAGDYEGVRVGETETTEQRRRLLLATDEWTYNFGPDRFVYYLSFRYGRLMEIRSGGYGH